MIGSEALARFIRWVMRDVTYLGTYPCTVMGQVGKKAEVLPDSDKIKGLAGLSSVPIRDGIPGCDFTIAPGAKVLLAFDNGDPTKPYIALWEGASLITLSLGGGTMPVARVGDSITGTAGPYPVTGTIIGGSAKVTA